MTEISTIYNFLGTLLLPELLAKLKVSTLRCGVVSFTTLAIVGLDLGISQSE
jgi:hypothetical protein